MSTNLQNGSFNQVRFSPAFRHTSGKFRPISVEFTNDLRILRNCRLLIAAGIFIVILLPEIQWL